MDRNQSPIPLDPAHIVALRKESVDRYARPVPAYIIVGVALRKESVDRNALHGRIGTGHVKSLSARRAWIEICARLCTYIQRYVALRKESVDRNNFGLGIAGHGKGSLSARRAWIEIKALQGFFLCAIGRSPQGERG